VSLAAARAGSPGLILAAPASGSGKSTITLALLRLLARRGVRVAPAKTGPDYIDSAFHAAAAGRPSVSLDTWAMRSETLSGLVAGLSVDSDLILCEGVMGLFDGIGVEGAGSTAELAALTGWPVMLVLDIRGQSASAAAVLTGFVRHRPDVRVAGAILNRAGSAGHAETVAEACRRAVPEVAILGALGRDPGLSLPERHLGLVPAREHGDLAGFLDRAADLAGAALDLDALRRLAAPATLAAGSPVSPLPPLGQRIAVADDAAFAFACPAVLEGWRRAGAEILTFSPLADAPPPPECDAVYLPGGYPELHAGRLAAGRSWRDGLDAAAARGAVVFGECGGYMALGRGLVDAAGQRHEMAGLLPVETSFASRRLHLGYREAALRQASPLGPAGARFRGHEFHYATIVAEGAGAALFDLADARGRSLAAAGRRLGSVAGSFVHLIDRRS
jgi:cobyrinic acid a,c-diamide synthase